MIYNKNLQKSFKKNKFYINIYNNRENNLTVSSASAIAQTLSQFS